MTRPLCIDLFCGLGGWTEGFLAEGWDVIGFDIEEHVYGEQRYPAQLVIQDVLTLDGAQFRDAACIVASPPCQKFSYMAMPWTRAKEEAKALRAGSAEDRARLTALFDASFRIQREACAAAGRHVPLVVENVCGAQKWVGRARWHFGSYYLWGDVPALMPIPHKAIKVTTMGAGWYPPTDPRHVRGLGFNTHAARETRDAIVVEEARKQGGDWFREPGISAHGSKSSARRAVSARIAKIPAPLARHIARCFDPRENEPNPQQTTNSDSDGQVAVG